MLLDILNSTIIITTIISENDSSISIENYNSTQGEDSSSTVSSSILLIPINKTENSTSPVQQIETKVFDNDTTHTNYTEYTTPFTIAASEIEQLTTNASNEREMAFNKTIVTTVPISEMNTSTQPTTTNSTTEENNRLEGFGTVVGEEAVKTMLEELKKRVERRLGLGAAECELGWQKVGRTNPLWPMVMADQIPPELKFFFYFDHLLYSVVELTEYRQHLQQMLTSVESALTKLPTQLSDFPKSQRYNPMINR